ncbi:unnamed protein product, partial [Lampetra planeri]
DVSVGPGRETSRPLKVKAERQEGDSAPDVNLIKVEIPEESGVSRDGAPLSPDRNFIEVELSEEEDDDDDEDVGE